MTAENVNTPGQAVADALDRIVDEAERDDDTSFAALVKAAGLDPAHDFIGASLTDLDFRDEDLRGFDFSRADLTGADFRRANLAGVRFDDAVLTGAIGLGDRPLLPKIAISYRRADTEVMAGRIRDRLADRYGERRGLDGHRQYSDWQGLPGPHT